jgi:dTDP-4-amino-4,6-dideoxygalactose transaminase
MSFDRLFEFEEALANYTGAPYAVATDCGTHAIELCLRYDHVTSTRLTAFTYLSIPQTLTNLDIHYRLITEYWQNEYQFHDTRIWDSARRLEPGMYRPGQLQCLSFGHGKPLELGRAGAILLDNENDYRALSRMRADGRDLRLPMWWLQTVTEGWHYCPTLETCEKGIRMLPFTTQSDRWWHKHYPDCRELVRTF